MELDARFKHPFTCLISGPSGSGKSTFVSKLIARQQDFVDVRWDYVYVFMGTKKEQNPILSSLSVPEYCSLEIFEVKEMYGENLSKSTFSQDIEDIITKNHSGGLKGCLIFDDLMVELAECKILVSLFTKFSSHASVSVINITQNLFFRGKSGYDGPTLYRNSSVIVLFHSPLDQTMFRIAATRMSALGNNSYPKLLNMLTSIAEKYRYVIIRGKSGTPRELKFSSDIFGTEPFVRQRVFQPRGAPSIEST